jgi:hypothetical protein
MTPAARITTLLACSEQVGRRWEDAYVSYATAGDDWVQTARAIAQMDQAQADLRTLSRAIRELAEIV